MPKIEAELAVWFDVPDDPLNGRVLVRHIPDGEVGEISALATDLQMHFVDGKVERHSGYKLLVDQNETICRSVKDWQNFFDESGQEQLPCTDANKLLYGRQNWFRPFVAECRKKLREQYEAQQEKKRKNSSALPSGSRASAGKAAKHAG